MWSPIVIPGVVIAYEVTCKLVVISVYQKQFVVDLLPFTLVSMMMIMSIFYDVAVGLFDFFLEADIVLSLWIDEQVIFCLISGQFNRMMMNIFYVNFFILWRDTLFVWNICVHILFGYYLEIVCWFMHTSQTVIKVDKWILHLQGFCGLDMNFFPFEIHTATVICILFYNVRKEMWYALGF